MDRLANPARTIHDLPDGAKIVLRQREVSDEAAAPDGTRIEVEIYAPSTLKMIDARGRATTVPTWQELAVVYAKRLLGGPTFYVRLARAAHGWGPLAYEIAMERATELGAGATPDPLTVSADAQAVWRHFGKRRDVRRVDLQTQDLPANAWIRRERGAWFPRADSIYTKSPKTLLALASHPGVRYEGDWTPARRWPNPVGKTTRALSLREVLRWRPEAARRGVSEVARSPRGFVRAYEAAGGRLERMDPWWRARREAFLARHLAQVAAHHEPLFDKAGPPTRRHLALVMWAYSPEPTRLARTFV